MHIEDDVVELGVVSDATKGSYVTGDDQEMGKQPPAGLTDD